MSQIVNFLKSEITNYQPIVQSFLDGQKMKYAGLTPEYAELLGYLEAYLLRGGKWIRPSLGLLGYQVAGGTDDTQARKALTSLEVFHRYILIQDDIIDQDLERHGGETIEKKYIDRFSRLYPDKKDVMYSKGMALVAGDVVNAMALELLATSAFDPAIIVAAQRAFNQLMMETVAGWQVQTEQNFQEIKDVTFEAFYTGMQLVSAQYSVVWPLRMGQILAGRLTVDSWDPALDLYGSEAGAAFQLADDLLGMFGDEATTGKPAGHDYREGKKTFLILHAFKHASTDDRMFLEQTLGTDVTDVQVERARSIMLSTGAVEFVKSEAKRHAVNAKSAITQIKTEHPQALNHLSDLADFLANREV